MACFASGMVSGDVDFLRRSGAGAFPAVFHVTPLAPLGRADRKIGGAKRICLPDVLPGCLPPHGLLHLLPPLGLLRGWLQPHGLLLLQLLLPPGLLRGMLPPPGLLLLVVV